MADSALIRQTLAGQTECFAVLMERHLGVVRRRIGSLVRNTTDLDDVIQEVLVKVWRHLSQYRSEASFRTWMTSVAINETVQFYRTQQRRPVCQPYDLDTFASRSDSPHQALARLETDAAIRSAVAALPAKYRQVLTLRHLEQLSVRDTAQRTQSSIPAVKARLFRARLVLSATLQRSRIRGLASAA